MIALQIILFLAIAGIFHSYILFPLTLKFLASGKKLNYKTFSESEELPFVSVIMAAYNEESVIEDKIKSILNSDYPSDKIKIFIGSDNSSDNTNIICEKYASAYSNIHFKNFNKRQGKVSIVNKLEKAADSEILILTDANVMFKKDTIHELIKYFKDENIGLVDSRMTNTGLKKEGISFQEKSYISREVIIKHHESVLWGSMMGPFGGCYAIRKELYKDVPFNFLVDDFFINMNVLKQNKKCINSINAEVSEDISNNLGVEFRRKTRIATGNFQNLIYFRKMLFPPWRPVPFCFISHKALRWAGPFLILIIIAMLAVLMWHYNFYMIMAFATIFVFILPVFDFLLKKIKIHNVILRFATHFLTMNLALFVGFTRILKGVKSNVWKPTKRHQ